jgi:hypothetical protein
MEASVSGTAPDPQQGSSAGFFHHLWGWVEATMKHLQLRTQLALLEAREASSHYAVIAGLLVAALIVAVFAYVFLILTAVFALAEWMDGDLAWLKITAGATAVHVLLAAVLVLMAKTRLKAGVFEKTKEEFRKDILWHKTPPHPNPPTT